MTNIQRRALIASLLSTPVLTTSSRAQVRPATPRWPHTSKFGDTTIVVYQPQAIAWPDHANLTARAAIAITRPADKTPVLGSLVLVLSTRTDAATGMVSLDNVRLTESHFPTLDTAAAMGLDQQIRAKLADIQLDPVPLQSVLLSLKEVPPAQGVPVQNEPPVIFHSQKPASLVVFDGDPVLAPIGRTGLSFAINTNWDVITDGHDWYLLVNGLWLRAPGFDGPYAAVSALPAAFSSIPPDPNFADVRKAIPPRPAKGAVVPVIFVSTKPAEVIITNGAPQFQAVSGTSLQVVSNTASALFLQPSTGRFFLLISGRWFASQGLDGPWHFATNDLPPDFAMIPPDGKLASVLPSVPGTAQAQLAVLQAQVPQQATLKKDVAKLTVVYAGPPEFRPIPGTTLTYAVNTSYEVIEAGGRFYACYQGAWFVAASPSGPWILADSVPASIYTIPPSFPLYNVTYVKVYAATPATVTYGYTAGYVMGFITAGVLVYGTGYTYPPVVIAGRVPVYYPYPHSYAGNVWYNPSSGAWARGGAVYGAYGGAAKGGSYYNPSTGAWGRGGEIYGPNGGVGGFSAYNPSTGGYARGSASWTSQGGTANASYYNPRTGVSGSTTQNANAYSRWGSSTFAGPNQTVNTASGSNARGTAGGFTSSTGAQGAGYRGANGNGGGAVKTQNGDVYAGHDGNVYQHGSDGWSKWGGSSGWQKVTPPAGGASRPSTQSQRTQRQPMESSSYQQLEQDRAARLSGGQGGWRGQGGETGRRSRQ
jgi:hypothetical protein